MSVAAWAWRVFSVDAYGRLRCPSTINTAGAMDGAWRRAVWVAGRVVWARCALAVPEPVTVCGVEGWLPPHTAPDEGCVCGYYCHPDWSGIEAYWRASRAAGRAAYGPMSWAVSLPPMAIASVTLEGTVLDSATVGEGMDPPGTVRAAGVKVARGAEVYVSAQTPEATRRACGRWYGTRAARIEG